MTEDAAWLEALLRVALPPLRECRRTNWQVLPRNPSLPRATPGAKHVIFEGKFCTEKRAP